MGMRLATSTAWPEGRRGRSGVMFDTVNWRLGRLLRQIVTELAECASWLSERFADILDPLGVRTGTSRTLTIEVALLGNSI